MQHLYRSTSRRVFYGLHDRTHSNIHEAYDNWRVKRTIIISRLSHSKYTWIGKVFPLETKLVRASIKEIYQRIKWNFFQQFKGTCDKGDRPVVCTIVWIQNASLQNKLYFNMGNSMGNSMGNRWSSGRSALDTLRYLILVEITVMSA